MTAQTSCCRRTADGVVISVRVQPRAASNQTAGLHDGAIKLRLTAPPVEGVANKACLAFLAKTLGLARSNLTIVSGQTGRNKQILIRPGPGQEWEDLEKMIRERLVLS